MDFSSYILKVKGQRLNSPAPNKLSQSCVCHLLYGITTLLPSTRHKWTRPALTQPDRPVLDLPTPEGRKAELTLSDRLHTEMAYPPIHGQPSSRHGRRRYEYGTPNILSNRHHLNTFTNQVQELLQK